MSNNENTIHATLSDRDSTAFRWLSESRAEAFISNPHFSDEMEGALILRFGDIQLGAEVIRAIQDKDRVLSDNYYWCKQADKGRISEDSLEHYCSDVDENDERLIATYGDRLFVALRDLREEWGVPYAGYGFDYLVHGSPIYNHALEEWKKSPEGVERMRWEALTPEEREAEWLAESAA